MSQYQAGVCNIGEAEVAKRRQVSYFGGFLYLSFVSSALLRDFTTASTISAIFPAMIFAVGFIQSRRKFCLAYGLMGSFNFQKLGTLTHVEDRDSLKADRKTAISILTQSLVLALLLTALAMTLNIFL